MIIQLHINDWGIRSLNKLNEIHIASISIFSKSCIDLSASSMFGKHVFQADPCLYLVAQTFIKKIVSPLTKIN